MNSNKNRGLKKLFWKILALDPLLMIGLLAITVYGVIVLYSASGASEVMFTSKLIQVGLGLSLMLIMAMFLSKKH